MGEKGIGGAAAAATNVPGGSSLIEKTTTSVVTSVTGVGSDVITAVQERAVGALADEAIKAARQRMSADDAGVTPEIENPLEEMP